MRFDSPDTDAPLDFDVETLIVAGWTGRDRAGVQHHIEELAALGVAPPSRTPLFYRVSASLLTQAPAIQVLGDATSGEAEPLILLARGQYWLGLASDHTDRDLEAASVAASKQACAKVCGPVLWSLGNSVPDLDGLHLRSWIATGDDAAWEPYQDGTLGAILPLQSLLEAGGLADGGAMLCGTLPAIGGVRPATRFRAELHDPERGRTLTLAYRAAPLPIVA